MSADTLELKNISKRFGEDIAVDQCSLSIRAGQHTTIVGSSGCGKSTLLRLISGLISPDSGEILLNEKKNSAAKKIIVPPHLRNIGFVFQDLALWPNLTVYNNILLALSAKRMTKQEQHSRVNEVLDLCDISSIHKKNPTAISGGQQQRVALARAIVLRPGFLLLDEPFSGLDLITKQKLMEKIRQLAQDQSITLILVTHDPFESQFFSKDVIILEEGKIKESGPFLDLLKQSKDSLMNEFRSQITV